MATYKVNPPFPVITDIDGTPLESGYIYIGTAGLDPETNPISVYFDFAQTLPASQPIRTLNGYPSNSGTPAKLFVAAASYSIRVKNKNSTTVYTSLTERADLQVNNEYETIALAKADTGLKDGDFVTTLGFYTKGDGGGAQYVVTNSNPSNVGYVNHLMSSGLWLALKHDGYISLKQAGAYGNGDLDLSGIDASPTYTGNDDTAAIQAVLDMANDKIFSDIYMPKGIYNVTTITFYKEATGTQQRGSFNFTGAGYCRPHLLRAGSVYNGSIFKIVSTTDFIDINYTPDKSSNRWDTNKAMSNVEISGFSVFGKTTTQLIRSYLIIAQSKISEITFYQSSTGYGWKMNSCYNGCFENIYGLGTSTPTVGSVGLYYETDYGAGGQWILNNTTMQDFDRGYYLGNTEWALAAYGGLNNCILRNIQGSGNNTNFDTGICFESRTNGGTGKGTISMYNPFFELPDQAGGANIRLKRCTSLYIQGGFIGGTSTYNMDHIIVSDEFTDNTQAGTTAPATTSEGGSIVIDGTRVSITVGLTIGEALVTLPDVSWYKVTLNNLMGRIYVNANAATLVRLTDSGTDQFYGSIKINDANSLLAFNGITSLTSVIQSFDGATATDATYYLHPLSGCAVHVPYRVASAGTLDLSFRPYLPLIIHCRGNATIRLPDPTDFVASTGVAIDVGLTTSITAVAGTVNITVSGDPAAADIIFNNAGTAVGDFLLDADNSITVVTAAVAGATAGYSLTKITTGMKDNNSAVFYYVESPINIIS